MGAGKRFAKFSFLSVNTWYALSGLILMSLGVVVLVTTNPFRDLVPSNTRLVGILSISFGALATCSTVIGYLGVFKDLRWVLVGYVIFLMAMAAVKIWMAVAIFVNLDDLYIRVRIILVSAIVNPELRIFFPPLENFLGCCGSTGADSYYNQGLPAPPSCCFFPINDTCSFPRGGCNTALSDFFEIVGLVIFSLAIVVAFAELVVAMSGMLLIHFINRELQAK